MMARQYYCLVSGFPDLILDDNKLKLTQAELKADLSEEVVAKDFALLKKVDLPIDNQNLINLLSGSDKPFLQNGNYSKEYLEAQIKLPDTLPEYMITFIEAFKDSTMINMQMTWENQLNILFYSEMLEDENSFIKDWFEFKLNLNNILAAFNCKKFNFSLEKNVIDVNQVAEMILKSNAPDFGLSRELSFLDRLQQVVQETNLTDREIKIDQIIWDFLDDLTTFDYFTIEKIISLYLQLGIAERWMNLDEEKGKQFFNEILKKMETSFSFPKEFILTGRKKNGS